MNSTLLFYFSRALFRIYSLFFFKSNLSLQLSFYKIINFWSAKLGCNKRRILCWFRILWNESQKLFRKTYCSRQKVMRISSFPDLHFLLIFLPIAFFLNILWGCFNEFGISLKFIFGTPSWNLFWVMLEYFANFECTVYGHK